MSKYRKNIAQELTYGLQQMFMKRADSRPIESRRGEYVYGNIKVLSHQKALEYDLCLMFYVEHRW